jgi:cell division septal protein FtsQ
MIGTRKFRTPTVRKRERIRVASRLVMILLVVFVVSGGVLYLLHLPQLRVHDIVVRTEGSLDTDTVASAIHTVLEDSYLHLVPKDSTLFVSSEAIEEDLRTRFLRINAVDVERTGIQGLQVSIAEREPVALWCGDVVPPIAYSAGKVLEKGHEEVWGDCYLVDAGGFIYAGAPVYTGSVFPRYYGSLEHSEPTGQHILAQDEFVRFQKLFEEVAASGRVLQAVLLVDERDIELYLEGGIRIQTLRSEVPDLSVRRLHALFSANAIDPNRVLEYVDMRFENKVYVKYAGGASDSAPATTGEEGQ